MLLGLSPGSPTGGCYRSRSTRLREFVVRCHPILVQCRSGEKIRAVVMDAVVDVMLDVMLDVIVDVVVRGGEFRDPDPRLLRVSWQHLPLTDR